MQVNKKERNENICIRYAKGELSSTLAKEYGLTKQAIINILRKGGVEVRRKGREMTAIYETITCRYCGKDSTKNVVLKSKYCDMKCRKAHISKTDEEKRLRFNAYHRNYYHKNKKLL